MGHEEYESVRGDREPTHPGVVLRDTVLPATGLSITAVAQHLQVTRQQLHRILSTDSGISSDMAVRLGKLCGNGPSVWLRMQEAYDLWHSTKKLAADVERIPTLQAAVIRHGGQAG